MPNVGLSETAQRLRQCLLSTIVDWSASEDSFSDSEEDGLLESPVLALTSTQALRDLPSDSGTESSDGEADDVLDVAREPRRVRQARSNLLKCLEAVWEIVTMQRPFAVDRSSIEEVSMNVSEPRHPIQLRMPWSELAKYSAALLNDLQDPRVREIVEISACLALLVHLCHEHIMPATYKDARIRASLPKSEAKAVPVVVKHVRRLILAEPTLDTVVKTDLYQGLPAISPIILLRLAKYTLDPSSRYLRYLDLSSLSLDSAQEALQGLEIDFACQIFGIHLEGIVRVDISGNNLSYLPPFVADLSDIEVINASRNPRLTTLPCKVLRLRRLRRINTRHTGLTANGPSGTRQTIPLVSFNGGPPDMGVHPLLVLATSVLLHLPPLDIDNALTHLCASLRDLIRASYLCEICDGVSMPAKWGHLEDAQTLLWRVGDRQRRIQGKAVAGGKSVWLSGRICADCYARYRGDM